MMKNISKKQKSVHTRSISILLIFALIFTFCMPVCSFATSKSSSNEQKQESASSQQNSKEQPPEKPDGSNNSGDAPAGDPPDGKGGGNDNPPSGNAAGGADTQSYDFSGTYNASSTADGEEVNASENISATDSSSNAILAQNGGTMRYQNGELSKTGDTDDGDSCNFYGINSVALAVGSSSKMYINDAKINSNASGANGIFATDGATIFTNNTSINSTKDNSRGLDATYGGTIIANSMNISTAGAHCAGIATDRGGGNISITNSSISTQGDGSPVFYSTGALEANAISGTASGSQIACIEGMNSLLISNSSLESTQTTSKSGDGISNAIMVYQSTSGDADTSTGEAARLQLYKTSLKSSIEDGSMFYFTNTNANVVLSECSLDFNSDSSKLITAAGNDASKNWGSVGKNGATVSFAAHNQQLNGEVEADTISSLNLYLLDASTWTGFSTITENSEASTVDEPLTINISSDSKWVVTKDCNVSNLYAEDGAQVVDANGKTVSIVANGKTVVEGDSNITITVNNEYGSTFSTSQDQELQSATIDRSSYDSEYAVQTSFDGISESGELSKAEQTNSNLSVSTTQAVIGGILAALVLIAIICIVAYKTQGPKRKNKEEKVKPIDD